MVLFSCKICKKGFVRESAFKTHVRKNGAACLVCLKCGTPLSSLTNKKRHEASCKGASCKPVDVRSELLMLKRENNYLTVKNRQLETKFENMYEAFQLMQLKMFRLSEEVSELRKSHREHQTQMNELNADKVSGDTFARLVEKVYERKPSESTS